MIALDTNILVYSTRIESPWFATPERVVTELTSGVVVGGAIHDARIAALCIYHGVSTLYSADRDFSRFPRRRAQNPLV